MAGKTSLIPLFILLGVVAIGAYIAYHMLAWSNELAERGKKTMEKQNLSFTKDGGLKVQVKEMSSETYADKTQNILVNTWNNASFPAYKSRLGWNSSQAANGDKKSSTSPSPRPGASRESSESSKPATARSSNAALYPPEQRGTNARRSASPLPGGWD